MRGRLLLIVIALCAALAIAGCGSDDDSSAGETTTASESEATTTEDSGEAAATASKPKVTVPSGQPPSQLETKDLKQGSGPAAKAGDVVTVNYVGVGYDSGEEFDASWGGEPFSFTLGGGEVIPGWDQGIVGMKPGGQRELTVPPDLAYGAAGYPPTIGQNETLIFVVDLISAE